MGNMLSIFEKNGGGGVHSQPKVLSIGYHITSFDRSNGSYAKRLEAAIDGIDKFLYAKDLGPVVYVRGHEIPRIFKK
jgi:hypothetical protein